MTVRPQARFLDRATPPHIATLILIAGLSALTLNMFLPSLPRMTEHFGTEYRLMQLSVALYLAVNAVMQIFVGPLSDRFGRRPVLLWGVGLFILATVGCIFAPTVEVFLAFRMAQAVVVVGLVLSRAVVRDLYGQDEAASMIGYVTMGMALVPMVGPAIGGLLDQLFGWQASFWLLALLGVATLWLVVRDMGETATSRPATLRAQFAQYPELFASRRFWGYCFASAFSSGAFFVYLGGAPYVGSVVFGLTPAVLGLYFGAPALGYVLGNFISGRYSVRYGINAMIFAGALVTCIGLVLALGLFYAGIKTAAVFFGAMTFVGFGNGMVLPNATAGMLSVRPHLAGSASGLGGAIMLGAGAALSAGTGTVLTPENGAFTAIWMMLVTSLMALGSILYTVRRARQIGA
jgi:DHA1 family bicyclomycin/chloramphenicol resistance-like MFS transporter